MWQSLIMSDFCPECWNALMHQASRIGLHLMKQSLRFFKTKFRISDIYVCYLLSFQGQLQHLKSLKVRYLSFHFTAIAFLQSCLLFKNTNTGKQLLRFDLSWEWRNGGTKQSLISTTYDMVSPTGTRLSHCSLCSAVPWRRIKSQTFGSSGSFLRKHILASALL